MRFEFPKKKRTQIPFFPLLSSATVFLVLFSLIGEGGLMHALALRMYKEKAQEQANTINVENLHLQHSIDGILTHSHQAKKVLASKRHLGENGVVIYEFKKLEQVTSFEELAAIEDLFWWDRMVHRAKLALDVLEND